MTLRIVLGGFPGSESLDEDSEDGNGLEMFQKERVWEWRGIPEGWGGMGGGQQGCDNKQSPTLGGRQVLEIRVSDSSQLSRGARELQPLSLYPSVNS